MVILLRFHVYTSRSDHVTAVVLRQTVGFQGHVSGVKHVHSDNLNVCYKDEHALHLGLLKWLTHCKNRYISPTTTV